MIRVYDGQGGNCLDAEEHMMFGHSPIPASSSSLRQDTRDHSCPKPAGDSSCG